jgi:hypothetical protein
MNTMDFTKHFSSPESVSLITAIVDEDSQKVRQLVSRGANLDSIGKLDYTPLRVAIVTGSADMVALLLELGANPNFRTSNGTVAAKWACETERDIYLKMLLDNGLNPNITFGKDPIIFTAVENHRWPQYDLLVKHGAKLDARSGNKSNLGHYFANQAEYARLRGLITAGIDVTPANNAGLTVIGVLADQQNRFGTDQSHPAFSARVELIQLLRSKGHKIPPNIPGVSR